MAAGTDKLDEIHEAEAFEPVTSRKRQGGGETPLGKSRNTVYEPDSADPDLQLRIVRSATQSIFEAAREDERRQIGKRANRRRKRETFNSLMGTIKRKTFSSSNHEKQRLSARRDALNHPNRVSAFHQEEQEAKAENFVEAGPDQGGQQKDAESRRRRILHVNVELSPLEKDKNGEPLVRYATNKVRTSKYTLLTFLPRNLVEQFRRVANLYFLLLVILQLFPIFGGSLPQVAAIPLLAILVITGAKDAFEDYRRHALDTEVNNSAATRLGGWDNVNQPKDTRNFFQRLFGLKPPEQRVSKGVRKLRQREGDFSTDFLKMNANEGTSRANLTASSEMSLDQPEPQHYVPYQSSEQQYQTGLATHVELDESVENLHGDADTSYAPTASAADRVHQLKPSRSRSFTIATGSVAPSARAGSGEMGVVDYSRQAPGTAHWERTLWKKLVVGDLVCLKEDDAIPADMIVLSSSDQDGNCFVETKNLDGETNLKPRRSLRSTMGIQSEEDAEHSKFILDSEPPHANLYAYSGTLRYWQKDARGIPGTERREGVTVNELLLRGCSLRNTAWVIGLVVFTGSDTKIMLNQGATPSKRSKIEKETNFNVLANFLILVVMCLACAIADGYFNDAVTNSPDFYDLGNDSSSNVVLSSMVTFGATLILYQNLIPIALVISVELVKSVQAYFIHCDLSMYYQALDLPCVPKSWNISDDLGQIEYIFSDKTGTLTQNVMEFMKCSVNGVRYGEGITEANKGAALREGQDTAALDSEATMARLAAMKNTMIADLQRQFKNPLMQPEDLTLIAPQLPADLANRESPQRDQLISFFRALALCQTVLADRSDTSQPNVIKYKAESPDEAALVSAARDVGFVFLARTSLEVDIEVMGQRERWTPLRTLEFNSTRKRMSVIVRSPDNKILLISKGADSVIYQRLRSDHDSQMKERTNVDLEAFANGGLRTLCVAQKFLTEAEFMEWSRTYDAACSAVDEREEEMERACELIEKDLTLIGATALEDKLQAGVPEAIEKLHQAGIKLWILTGDKLQTAIEIGFSCNLLKPAMDILIISAESDVGARAQVESGLAKVSADREAAKGGAPPVEHAVVIDGETLRSALADELKPLFLELTTQCETVVCCRVSPAQKAQTVKLVKDGKKAMTLSIGDGANDVAMIQEANVGVGISGLEGAQASMSADYAVGQFRYLQQLLLVHGRWCYKRVAIFHEVFFYKNVIWTFPMFWFQFYCNFNASLVMDYSFLMLFSVVFTALPVILLGAFDQDVDAKTSLQFPLLYRRGIAGLEYTRVIFFSFIIDGVYQSVICFFVPFLTYYLSPTQSITGRSSDSLAELGTTIAIATIIATNIYTGMMTRYWTKLFVIITFLSTVSVILWTAIYSLFPYALYNIVVELFSTAPFYATIILVQVLCLLPRFLYLYIQNNYFPLDIDIIQERRLLKQQDQEHAASDLPSAIALPHSPPPIGDRAPSYTSVAPQLSHMPQMTETPTSQSPLRASFYMTPPMGSTSHFGTPEGSWQHTPSSDIELAEYVREDPKVTSVEQDPHKTLTRQASRQSFETFRSQETAPGYAF